MTQGIEQVVGATLVSVRNGPGMRLRAAREAIGATPEEIAQQLRLKTCVITQLEEDDYTSDVPLVFMKGYLRAYAQLVGVNPEQAIIEFGHLGVPDPARQVPDLGHSLQGKLGQLESSHQQRRPGLLWGSVAAVVCGVFAFGWIYWDQLTGNMGDGTSTVSEISSSTTAPQAVELNTELDAASSGSGPATEAPSADATAPESTSTPTTPPQGAATSIPGVSLVTPKPAPVASVAKAPVKQSTAGANKSKAHETMLF